MQRLVNWYSADTSTSSSKCWTHWNHHWYTTSTSTTITTAVYVDDVYRWTDGDVRVGQAEQTTAREQQAREEQAREREEANKRAEALLHSLLSQEQLSQYRKQRTFDVLTTRTGETRRYRIEHGVAGNIYRLDDNGKPVERFCIHIDQRAGYPVADNLIVQKLLLEADEEQFLQIANRSIIDRRGEWTLVGRAA